MSNKDIKIKVVKTIRSQKAINAYLGFIKNKSHTFTCGICQEKSLKDFKYWRIVKARFPLDKISTVDHLVMPIRHVNINKLNNFEKAEFELIKKKYLRKKYDALLEGTPKSQSVLDHHHIHLLVWKLQ